MATFLVILPLIILPFLTYYISTVLFYRTANSQALEKRPPTIPYFIPGVFHTFTLAYDGPKKYFATLLKQYGNFAPFVVKAGSRSIVVLRDPAHIKKVLQASTQLTSTASDVETLGKLFGAPKEFLAFSAEKNGNAERAQVFKHAPVALPQKYLTDTPLASLTSLYISLLSRNLNDKMFQVGSWTQIEDFLSFFQQVVTRCTVETLFGSAIFRQYPNIVKDYQKFADAADGFSPAMPSFIVPAAYEGPRNRLLRGIERWLKTNHSGSEFAKIGDQDPVWDEHRGSKYIQERDDVFAKAEGIGLEARAAEMLSVLLGSTSSVLPTAFWTIVEGLRKPHVLKPLAAEISQWCSKQSGKYDIASIASMPLFQSVNAEVKRLRVATATTRTNEGDQFQLDKQWTLPQGVTAMFFSHDLSLHTDVWAKARPQTLEKPLEDFWAERFLISDREKSSMKTGKQRQDKSEGGRFSLEGLEPLSLVSDTDAVGREYATAVQAATLAVLLTEFELQLCDPEAVEAAMPPVREIAYGTVKPLDNVAVRIRKRRVGEKL